MSRIICIANQKGGVGKTTTAVNLSASLAAAEKRVLLVDIDPQGNASSGAGIDKTSLRSSVYDLIINGENPNEQLMDTDLKNLQVIAATPDLAGAELELIEVPEREMQLKKILSNLKEDYDFIIIDCPPSLGLLTINAMTAANSVIVPLQTEFYAMEGLSQIVRTIGLVQKGLNPGLRIEGIVLTMYDGRNNLSRQVEDEIRAHFGDQVFRTVIPRNVRLSEAPSHGKPIILYDITSRGAVAYLELAKELMQRGGGNG
jgi:chromosome partitioning protein